MFFDEKQLRKAIALLKDEGELYEIRLIPKTKSYKTPTTIGYFDDVETLITELRKFPHDEEYTAYISLNNMKSACRSRDQYGCFLPNVSTTSSEDIEGYKWFFIDLDPVRIGKVSSSDEELHEAVKLSKKIYLFLSQLGFCKPIFAYSGNGVHLLYKISIANDEERQQLVKKCLSVLSMLFSTELIQIDCVTYDPPRICKLYGTVARKGRNTKERPHRLARIAGNYDEPINVTDIGYLKKLASLMPQEVKAERYNNYSPRDFNLSEWLDKYGIGYKTSYYHDGDKYILDHCPFNESHDGKDACIFKSKQGGIGFHCFHNSCADKTWKDVRLLFEPDAYEKKYQEREKQMYHTFNRNKPKESKPIVVEENKPLFYTAQDILDIPKVEETFIRTGFIQMDKKIRGLKKGFVSVVSGLRGSSKSTILSQISLNAIDDGNNVAFFSGELAPKNFMHWMNQQAAGKNRVEPSQFNDYYNVPYKYQKKIAEWMGKRFWLYNNEYGFDSKAILEQFEKAIVEKKLDLLILDNLMAFDLSTLNNDKWDAQKDFVWKLHNMAQKYEVHIAFVAHPKKVMNFLRLDDISGSSDIANAVEYAFIVHRNNNDFVRLTKQMFGWKDDNDIYLGSNIIEICKDRDGGTQDFFIPLHYEKESKRLKNYTAENIIYGWDNSDGFVNANELLVPEQMDIPF